MVTPYFHKGLDKSSFNYLRPQETVCLFFTTLSKWVIPQFMSLSLEYDVGHFNLKRFLGHFAQSHMGRALTSKKAIPSYGIS
jgi:hypothetical protein